MTKGVGLTQISLTVKSADPENPLFGARILMISLIQTVFLYCQAILSILKVA